MGVQGRHGIGADIGGEAAEGHRHLGRRAVGGPEPQVCGRAVDREGAAVALGEPREPADEAFGLHLDRPAAPRHLPGPRHPRTLEPRTVTQADRAGRIEAGPGAVGPARSRKLIVRHGSGPDRPP